MYVKTKSGFECEINERKVKDWKFAKALAKCDSGDESQALEGTTFIVPFLLGKEIMALVGAEIKKSQSSLE